MAGLLLPLLLLVGGYIYYTRFGGREQLDSILGELKGIGSGGFSSSGFEDLKNSGKTGRWTDENNNNFNIERDVNTQSNISGNGDDVQSILQQLNGKSGQNISRTRQIDTTGKAKQINRNIQRSNVFYTIPRFGNL